MKKSFGVAGAGHGQYNHLNFHHAWPSGQWGSLPIAGRAMTEFPRKIEAAPDPEAKRMEIETQLRELGSPLRTAIHSGVMGLEEVIDPRDTRPLLCEFVRQAQEVTATQLGPKYRGMRPYARQPGRSR